ncbi:MAG: DUF4235 domain-containing protein [Propionicimonas sp.]
MQMSRKVLWNVYATAVGALTVVIATKALEGAWRLTTGGQPPEPTDPNTPLRQAVAWTVASALGIGVTTVLVNRFAAIQWERAMGEPVPRKGQVDA